MKFARKARGHFIRLTEINMHLNMCVSGHNCQSEALQSSGSLLARPDFFKFHLFIFNFDLQPVDTGFEYVKLD